MSNAARGTRSVSVIVADDDSRWRTACNEPDLGEPMVVDYELNELKREFLDEAREKVDEMQTALGSVEERSSLDRLAYLAHQLKGSGGSYGYQRISLDAAELEKVVESLTDGNGNGSDAEKIQQYVVNLRTEIDRALIELRP
jgi:HPt (histidine-containing phosphotransfer) domain-containing protein